MCCPQCEKDNFEHWIVTDETNIHTDWNGKDWLHIVQGCQCNECGHIWYEHYTGVTTNFYWTNN